MSIATVGVDKERKGERASRTPLAATQALQQARSPWSLPLRAIAIIIATAGVVDPAFQRDRRVRPEISVVSGGSGVSPALVARTKALLARDFTVMDVPFPGASATVVVGNSLPPHATSLAGPVFALLPALLPTSVSITGVHHPRTASVDGSAVVETDIELAAPSAGNAGDSVVVRLREGGVLIDRVARPLARGERRVSIPVQFTPTREGLASLRVQSTIVLGGRESVVTSQSEGEALPAASADVNIDVRDARRSVLFHDARPSWMSTFVRRALELDPRLTVSSRTMTSRGIATESGRPPAIAGLDGASPFDVVIVGAPEALGAREIDALDAFARHGGNVVLLLDQQGSGGYERLTRVGAWTGRTESEPAALNEVRAVRGGYGSVTGDTTAVLRATEWTAPRTLPAGATRLLEIEGNRAPVVWSSSIGEGTLVVSGALDAWRYRDSTQSGFAPFWRNLVATLAEGRASPVAVSMEPDVLRPGEEGVVRVSTPEWPARTAGVQVRDALASVTALKQQSKDSISAPTSISIRLWPDGASGSLIGKVRAPLSPGQYRIDVVVAESDTARGSTNVTVGEQVARPQESSAQLLALWAQSHRGSVIAENDIDRLRGALNDGVMAPLRTVQWHPMRSAWWLLPFALLLSAEWWIRRRRGLA